MPYSDIPDGATVVSDPGQYSDLPPGSTIAYHPPAGQDWQSQVKPVPTFNGKQSVQRSDGAVWYGPDQGNTGKAGWFDAKGNRAGDAPGQPYSAGVGETAGKTVLGTIGGATTPVLSAIGAYGSLGNALAEHAGFNLPWSQEAADFAKSQAQYRQGLTQGTHGWAQAGSNLGETASQIGLAQLLPTAGLAEQAGTFAEPATTALGRIGQASSAGVASAVPYGVQAGLTTPPEQGQSYGQHMAGNLQGAMAMGGAVPGGLSALGESINGIKGVAKSIRARSVQSVLDELESRLGGKTPGVALQDDAINKYNDAWDQYKKAVAPVDAEAPNVEMDYSPAIDKLQSLLGIGQKRPPMAMPDARKEVLSNLLGDLQEAGDPEGNVSNDFGGAIDVIKKLGAAQRTLAQVHGDSEARGMLGDVRDSVMDSMTKSNPALADDAKAARKVFATQVVPLFDKSEGGQYLTQLRDTPTPNDLIKSMDQGSLAIMRSDKVGIIAKGSSADPLLFSMLDAANRQANGNPGSFLTSINKAMPAVDQIADPEMAAAFHGLANVASTSKWAGMLANIGTAAALGEHGNAITGGVAGAAALKYPALTGPGLMWKLLQNPATQKTLQYASQIPAGPELENLAEQIGKISGASYPFASGLHHPKSQEEYDAMPSGQPYQSISGAPGVKP